MIAMSSEKLDLTNWKKWDGFLKCGNCSARSFRIPEPRVNEMIAGPLSAQCLSCGATTKIQPEKVQV